jgi:hypothetical protein
MTICDICDFAGASIRCSVHPLNYGMVKELHQGMLGGQNWGNIICDAEEEALEKMSVAEKAALEKKKAAEEAARQKNIVSYTVNLRKKLYTSADGIAKRKFNRMCKKERYAGGCYLHNEKHGSCSFVHTDERSRYEAIFGGFDMKMVDDASFFTLLKKADAASGDVKYKMEKECDMMEMRLKKEARCLFVTGVDAKGELTFVKTNPEHHCDGHSSHSGGSKTRQPVEKVFWQQKSSDNSAW